MLTPILSFSGQTLRGFLGHNEATCASLTYWWFIIIFNFCHFFYMFSWHSSVRKVIWKGFCFRWECQWPRRSKSWCDHLAMPEWTVGQDACNPDGSGHFGVWVRCHDWQWFPRQQPAHLGSSYRGNCFQKTPKSYQSQRMNLLFCIVLIRIYCWPSRMCWVLRRNRKRILFFPTDFFLLGVKEGSRVPAASVYIYMCACWSTIHLFVISSCLLFVCLSTYWCHESRVLVEWCLPRIVSNSQAHQSPRLPEQLGVQTWSADMPFVFILYLTYISKNPENIKLIKWNAAQPQQK